MTSKIIRAFAAAFLTLVLFAAVNVTPARAQGSAVYTAKAPTTAAMLLVAGDSATSAVEIINQGTVTVYLGGSDVTASTGTPLFVNTRRTFKHVVNPIYGITASSTGALRITTVRGGGEVESERLVTTGIANSASSGYVPMSNGSDMVAGTVLIHLVSSAITANSTSCTDASGSLYITSNATGLGTVFRSDGTLCQLLSNYNAFSHGANLGTVATTGNTDAYVVAAYAGTLVSLDCSGVDALTANDTNYITATLTNLGQAGSGSNPMLAATAPNTTQATGGTAFAANTKRAFTVNGTGSNLIVAAGDRLRLRFAATGTLANTITFTMCTARFTRLS
jgi:hypothetical protein